MENPEKNQHRLKTTVDIKNKENLLGKTINNFMLKKYERLAINKTFL